MNKYLLKLQGSALCLAMAVGVGVAASSSSEAVPVSAATATPQAGYEWATMVKGTSCNAATVKYNSSTSHSAFKVGTSKAIGNFTITIPSGTTSLKFYAYAWNKVSGTKLNLSLKSGNVTPASIALTSNSGFNGNSTTFTFNGEPSLAEVQFSGVEDDTTLNLTSSEERFVFWDAQISKAAPKTLKSISIKNGSVKTTYYAGEKFDPTELVVIKHFDDGSAEDFPYAGNIDKFKFNLDLTTPLQETNTSIEITVEGKTVSLPIIVKPARTITSVTLNGVMTKKKYYEGDAWDVSGLYLTVTWNEGEPTSVQLSDLVSGTDYTIAPETASLGITSVDITGHYADKSFGGTISGLTVTEKPSSMQIAYEAAKELGLEGKTTVDYEFSGVVVGTIDESFFVQDEGYGMYVYNKAVPGLAVGKRIDIKSSLKTYKGMIETNIVSSATLGEEATMPTAATISSATDLKALKQNVLVDLEAVMPATMQNWSSSAGPLNTLTVGTNEIVMKFDKNAYKKSSVSGTYSSLAGKKVSIKNAISSTFNSLETKQLLLTEQTTIEVIEDDNAKALAFGTSFLNKTVDACADGTKDNSVELKTIWATLNTEFNALSDGAKKVVKEAIANNAGTDLEKAMARYDHIVKRYSATHTEINDFIGRGVTASLTNQLFKANTTNNIMVISLIACASAAAIGSFFFIRKRKEQN